jgi:predicted MFS family arabinose efflux permease
VAATNHVEVYFWMIIFSALLWFVAALFFAFIQEEKGATAGGKTPVKELHDAWGFFRQDKNLRRFIFTRGLLMAIPLAQPFFIVLGKQQIGSQASSLGIIVIAAGLANIVSSPFWGRFSDRSSRKIMRVVALLGVMNILLMLSFPLWPAAIQNKFGFAGLLLLQVMAHAGARLSRKTYLIDYAPEKHRPSYVSLSNTLIGIFTLIAAAVGLLAGVIGVESMLLLYATLLIAAWFFAGKLQEV